MISIVIPTHNRKELLKRAVDSVLNQTYKDIEVIVVSDGSTDGTSEIMKDYRLSDKRVLFFEYHPPRSGNYARNFGIKQSKGEYVAFLDDDDEWLPSKLEKQIEIMKKDAKVGLVYTGVKIIYENDGVKYSFIGKAQGKVTKDILLDNCIGTTSTVLIKKSVLDKVGGFDNNLAALQDYDLWIRICDCCNIGVIQEELVNYYNYRGCKQVSAVTQKYVDAFNYINEKYSALYSKLNKEEFSKKKSNECMLIANKAMRNGDSILSRKYIIMALRYSFTVKSVCYYLLSFLSYRTILIMRSLNK